jgi:dual specificity phosphatase 12
VIAAYGNSHSSHKLMLDSSLVMWSRRVNATQALEFVRSGWSHLQARSPSHALSVRNQIWPNPGFQEQLVLFELCAYNPSPSNGIYISWRMQLERRLAAAGMR